MGSRIYYPFEVVDTGEILRVGDDRLKLLNDSLENWCPFQYSILIGYGSGVALVTHFCG